MNEKEYTVLVSQVSKTFKIRKSAGEDKQPSFFNKFKRTELKALDNINFKIKQGEILGIIGRNGSGKSTLLNLIMGAMIPDKGGKIEVNGKILKLSLGMGFDQNLSARDNIYVNGAILGLSFKEIGMKFKNIVSFAEINKFIDVPVKKFSKGMKAKLGFSIAIHSEADVYLFDEFFGGVGDEVFKKKSGKVFLDKFFNNKTVIMVSHRLGFINQVCDTALLLINGQQVDYGDPKDVINKYKEIIETK